MLFAKWIESRGGDRSVAAMLGISRFTVRNWRLGVRTPRPWMARRLASIDPALTLVVIYPPMRPADKVAAKKATAKKAASKSKNRQKAR